MLTRRAIAGGPNEPAWRPTPPVHRGRAAAVCKSPRQDEGSIRSTALQYTAVLSDEMVAAVSLAYLSVELTKYQVDALAARLISTSDSLT